MVTEACATVTTVSTKTVGSEERLGRSTQVHGRWNRRAVRQAEGAETLAPKGTGSGTGAHASAVTADAPSAERPDLTQGGTQAERGKPVVLPEGKARRKGSPWGCGDTRMEKAKALLS